VDGESPKADKPPTPNTEKIVSGSLKPLSPGGAQSSPGAGGASSSSAKTASSLKSACATSNPRPVEYPKTSPPNPWSYGLRSTGEFPLGGDSSVPHSEEQPRQYSPVAESLADNPEFIKLEIHIRRFITVVVDTEVN
jgi:hypothetical protein